ncbi:MAG: glycosyl hydrolase [Steroidobacteraceae bacterium]
MVLGTLVGCSALAQDAGAPSHAPPDSLIAGFQDPPAAARPRVWWHWMNGNITQEGIRLDLEWMHRIGIGGLQNFDASLGTPKLVDQSLIYMTPEWQRTFRYTVDLADKLGMELSIAGSPGWSESGGPWIRPDQAMKKLVWSETRLEGGQAFSGVLAAPPSDTGPFQNVANVYGGLFLPKPVEVVPNFYRDVAVTAYRLPDVERSPLELHATVTSSAGAIDAALLSDGDLVHGIDIPFGKSDPPAWILFTYPEPQTVQALTASLPGSGGIAILGGPPRTVAELQSSNDGQSFQRVVSILTTPEAQSTLSFAPVTARYFRVVLLNPPPQPVPEMLRAMMPPSTPPTSQSVTELVLHAAPRIEHFEEKAAYYVGDGLDHPAQAPVPAEQTIDPASIVDLTKLMRADGTLSWTPPPGRWMVLRLGYSLLGIANHPASPDATGLEVDKLSRADVKFHMDTYLGKYESFLGKNRIGAHGLHGMVNDSWEAGAQNWSETVPEEFARRRGYDLHPWLPALTGQVIGSVGATEAFLWDFRRTLGEILADSHYGQINSSLHARGLIHYGESHESGRAFIGDGMDVKRGNDVPMSAMWIGGFAPQEGYDADVRESASVAHLYGQNLVAAESMTSTGPAFAYAPVDLKPTVDRELDDGLNRFVIHTSVHQPLIDKPPGVTLGPFGQWFTRNETWADQAKPWISYLARSSYLLQQGHYAADVLYFYGQDSNLTALYHDSLPAIPSGYAYDFANVHALGLLSVKGGRLVTASGMQYRVLALDPRTRFMSLDALRLIGKLVDAGATVAGDRPESSPSLADKPAEFTALVNAIWGSAGTGEHHYGQGRVLISHDWSAVMHSLGLPPDFEYTRPAADTTLWFVHRHLEHGELYFVNNRRPRAESVTAIFRVSGRVPELWHADTGQIEAVSYRMQGDRTIVPLALEPSDAVFVIFRKLATGGSLQLPDATRTALSTLEGSWRVTFQAGRGAPAEEQFDALSSWTTQANPGIKYFSGTASYRKTLEAPATWFGKGRRLELDLGAVSKVAQVFVNGQDLGILWKVPYRIDVTSALHSGANQIEIRVTNLWVNRLIGDRQPGATAVTFTTFNPYQADSPLLESGLLGPVTVSEVRVNAH